MNVSPKEILELLISKKIIDRTRADQIELDSLNRNIPIDTYLFKETVLKKIDILSVIAESIHVAAVDIATVPVDSQALGFISEQIARKYTLMPYQYNPKEETIFIASTNPLNVALVDFLEKKTGKKIVFTLGYEEDIKKTIDLGYAQSLSPEVKEALKEVTTESRKPIEDVGTVIKEAPIAKIVNTILEFAVKSRASDVHIEAGEAKTRVRYRIDGILQEKLSLPKGIHEALISRIKILSQMKIDEKRVPQDGRFGFKLGNEEVDLRVSSLPTVNGEKIVMRLLKKTGGMPSLDSLGLRGPQYKDLQEAITKPYGIILVTGPTGSGKTTTLYSILSALNKPGVNIVTLEDPVEYQIAGINQVQTNPQAGLTFANGLRAFLRQDPNIILVGEIRDRETTELAIQAALTGHLVFSTLHTNDASTAIPRLIDLGGEPFLIASVLNLSLAQRITRRICDDCRELYEPPPEIVANIKNVLGDLFPKQYLSGTALKLAKGQGCGSCNNTGYRGRVAIFEVLKITPTITKMILQEAGAKDIEDQAKRESLIMMKQDGYLKALDGITTIEEVLRVAEV